MYLFKIRGTTYFAVLEQLIQEGKKVTLTLTLTVTIVEFKAL